MPFWFFCVAKGNPQGTQAFGEGKRVETEPSFLPLFSACCAFWGSCASTQLTFLKGSRRSRFLYVFFSCSLPSSRFVQVFGWAAKSPPAFLPLLPARSPFPAAKESPNKHQRNSRSFFQGGLGFLRSGNSPETTRGPRGATRGRW